MALHEAGSVYVRGDGKRMARVRTADGKRISVELPDGLDDTAAKAEAAEVARVVREKEREQAVPAKPQGELVDAWVERWFADRERRGLTSVEADRPRWSKWVAPHIGAKAMVAVTRDDLEGLVEAMDAAIVAGTVRWKTMLNAWTLVCGAFSDACASKTRALRVRTDNPTADVRGPERGSKRSKAVLFPGEVLRFLRSPRVPLAMRRMVAIAIYTGMRPGELRALRWPDVDLENGTVLVHEQVDRKKTRRDTKTKSTRRVPIEQPLFPLLRAMHREVGGEGPVVTYPIRKHTPRVLRASLERAGVTRQELHVAGRDRSRVAVRVHDTRGTYATWCAARGDQAFRIAAACGHATLSTTQGYVQAGEVLRDVLRDVFPPLPAELLGEEPTVDTPGHGADTGGGKAPGSLWVDRDSKPRHNGMVSRGSAGDRARGVSDVGGTPANTDGTPASPWTRVTADPVPHDAAAAAMVARVRVLLREGRSEDASTLLAALEVMTGPGVRE